MAAGVSREAPKTPPRGTNSWTAIPLRDAQEVISRRVGSSPLAGRVHNLPGRIDNEVDRVQQELHQINVVSGWTAAENPPAVATADLPTAPVADGPPVGNDLTLCPTPKTLFSHVPVPLRELVSKQKFLDLRQLQLDPKIPLKRPSLTLKRTEDGKLELEESNHTREITNWDQWVWAYHTYASIMVQYFPHRSLEMIKYEHVIHDASQRFEWDAMMYYDVQFCLNMAENPEKSWGTMDMELYADAFTGRGLKTAAVQVAQKFRSSQACYQYNKGKCTWGKKCKFAHKCGNCGKFGHPEKDCRSAKGTEDGDSSPSN